MRRALTLLTALATIPLGAKAYADEAHARRVLVGGAPDDPVVMRLSKELGALGFETVRGGPLEGCARSAVVTAALDAQAIAAACSSVDQVGVWTSEGSTFRLRDVVVAAEGGAETLAVRAAEVTRATIALRESEETEPKEPPVPVLTADDKPPARDAVTPAPTKPLPRYAPLVSGSVGISTLLGIDVSVASVSGELAIGVLRRLAVAARIEYPLEDRELTRNSTDVAVAPAFAGLSAVLPVTDASSFIIPRFGAGAGVVWVRATHRGGETFGSTGLVSSTPAGGDATVVSPAVFASAGLSMRVGGPLRVGTDGLLGATASRVVVRDRGTPVAFYGVPFGALALRVELMFP